MTEPCLRRRIKRRLVVVAEQSYRIPLDIAAAAFWPGIISKREPQKRHPADDLAHFALQNTFAVSHVALRCVSIAPGGIGITVAVYQCRADYESEDRASMIATAGALLAFVLG